MHTMYLRNGASDLCQTWRNTSSIVVLLIHIYSTIYKNGDMPGFTISSNKYKWEMAWSPTAIT